MGKYIKIHKFIKKKQTFAYLQRFNKDFFFELSIFPSFIPKTIKNEFIFMKQNGYFKENV